MKKFFYLALLTILFSCSNARKGNVENEQTETKETEDVRLLSDVLEVVSVETGWYDETYPQVSIKLRNKSGNAISKFIAVKYQFIEKDEILDEGSRILHSVSNVSWDDGICKTIDCRSKSGYFGGVRYKVRAIVCFGDDSPIWEGDIEQRIVY